MRRPRTARLHRCTFTGSLVWCFSKCRFISIMNADRGPTMCQHFLDRIDTPVDKPGRGNKETQSLDSMRMVLLWKFNFPTYSLFFKTTTTTKNILLILWGGQPTGSCQAGGKPLGFLPSFLLFHLLRENFQKANAFTRVCNLNTYLYILANYLLQLPCIPGSGDSLELWLKDVALLHNSKLKSSQNREDCPDVRDPHIKRNSVSRSEALFCHWLTAGEAGPSGVVIKTTPLRHYPWEPWL